MEMKKKKTDESINTLAKGEEQKDQVSVYDKKETWM